MSTSSAKSFNAVLEPLRNGLGWVVARVPFDVKTAWPVRKGLRVRGEIAGLAFRSALRPCTGGGHFLLVNRKMQAAAKAGVGAKVRIKLEPDLEERLAVVPPELARAMKGDRRLRRWFDGLNDYTRRAICALVSEAKTADARERAAGAGGVGGDEPGATAKTSVGDFSFADGGRAGTACGAGC